MAYKSNKNKDRGPRKGGAMGWIVATAVATAPAIGCDDDMAAMPADTGAPTDTGSPMATQSPPDAGTPRDAVLVVDAGSAEAMAAWGDAATDLYPDGIRG